jgi:hypothetical protein
LSSADAQLPNTIANDPSPDPYPLITQSETTLAVSPANPDIILVAYNDSTDLGLSGAGWSRSTDGGNSWTDMGPVTLGPNQIVFTDPVLAASSSGIFYFASIVDEPPELDKMAVAASINGGQSFLPATIVDEIPSDRPTIEVDQATGNIYACWTRRSGPITFARSTDNGVQYSTPLTLSDTNDNGAVIGCSIAAGSGGDVFVAWYNDVAQEIRFRRSSDFGATFPGSPVTVGQAIPPPFDDSCCDRTVLNGNIRNIPSPDLAADPLDPTKIFVTWDSFVIGNSDVYFATSSNYGTAGSWTSPPKRVNLQFVGDQFQPAISSTVWYAAEPDTTAVRVLWYDRFRDPNNLRIEVWSAITFNDGQSFDSPTLWGGGFDPPQLCPYFECDSGIKDCYMGDYIALTNFYPTNSLFMGAWGDNRLDASGTPSVCSDGEPRPAVSPDPNVYVSSMGC